MSDSFQDTKLSKFGQIIASLQAVSSPSLPAFACPFCADTEVVLLMGKVMFSATMADEDLLAPVKVTLAALICGNSHMFFVRENDLTAMFPSQAA
jgi:hypothetical protein